MKLNPALRRHLWACPYEKIVEAWRLIVELHGNEGKRWLGRNDRYYLLVVLLHRPDALHPWLYERSREVERDPDGYLDLWAREHYKMLPLAEPVPTPTGWTTHGALQPGDWVFGPDGMPTRVVARTEVFTDGEAYELEFDDGTTMRAGADHLWTVERKTRRRVPGTHKGGAGKRVYREQVTLSTRDIATHDHRMDNRLAVPVNDPLVMPDALLPIPPYTLGAWLGDGHSRSPRLTCSYDDHQIVQEIRGEGIRAAECASPNENTGLYQLGDGVRGQKGTGLAPLLRALGILNNKHIPICYQRGSAAQRLALLQGLMDTDGHCNTRGTATFTNQTEALVDGVYELATGLGLKPTKRAYDPLTGRYWQVSFQAYQAMNPFRLERKAARAKAGARPHPRRFIVACRPIPPEPMSCIQVAREDGLYLAGKQMVTTHNSTIITYAGIIQEVIRDPEITIGIFSHTKPTARKFLLQIKQEFESNEELIQLYPDVFFEIPERQSSKWSEEKGLVVRRRSNPKEATIEAHGLVDGQPTGSHFQLLVYDDVVTLDSVGTPEQVAKTTAACSLSDNLGARGKDGKIRKWHIGTRYSYADSYHTMMEMGAVKPRIYAATDNGLPEGKPVFLSPEAWAEKKRNQIASVLAAQMLQNPAAGAQALFQKDWLRFAEVRPATLNAYVLCDPAGSKKKGSDYTAMAVVGIDAAGNKWLLDGRRHKMNLAERWDNLKALRRKWRRMPGVQRVEVGYERYGMQSDIEHFESEMKREGDVWEIKELAWPREGGGSKFDRIQRLEPDFKNGRFMLPAVVSSETAAQARVREAGQPFRIFTPVKARDHKGDLYSLNKEFLTEYLVYPYAVHDDVLDVVSRIYDMDPQPPVIVDERALEPEIYADGL